MRFIGLLVLVLGITLSGFLLGGEVPRPAHAAADGYAIDPVHSFVMFRIKHLDIGYVYGRFNEFSGTIKLDEASPSSSSVTVEVKATSVDTGVKQRDDHLRTPDFFAVAQFPTLTFKSTAVKKVDETHFDVTGDLTIHGVTKSVTVRMEKTGAGKDPWGKFRVGFEGTLELKRSDFEMKGVQEMVGDALRLTLAFEAVKN
jgi:polyisoprenoid-binding protein YceI